MRGGNRKFRTDAVQHIYQISKDGGVIFYDDVDRLVFYTVCSMKARQYGIQVLAMDIMYTHFHESIIAPRKKLMIKYMQDSTALFARLYGKARGRKGDLFRHSFGSVSKKSDKEIRSNLAYVNNNAVEKRLSVRAEDDRWNFLAYHGNVNPFSEKLDRHRMSKYLRFAINQVNGKFEDGRYLNYGLLNTLYKHLNDREKEQLTDYIVTKYMFIDFEAAASYFGSFETMLTAIASNTGNEYGMKENYDGPSDIPYRQMIAICRENGYLCERKKLFNLSEDEKLELFGEFLSQTSADRHKIGKFLHIQLE